MSEATPAEQQETLLEIARDFHSAMLVTRALNGDLRSRPMAVARIEEDGTCYFATDDDSEKVDEIERHGEVNLSFQSDKKFLSLSGRATILNDRALIDELWEPDWKVWFPEGKDDPSLRILRVDGRRGEYWDISGTEGIAFLWEAGKALVQGKKMTKDPGHQKVELSA